VKSYSRSHWRACFFVAVLCTLLSLTVFAAAANPVPYVSSPVSPTAVAPGSAGFTLNVYGAGFVPGAVVNWNGSARSTTFVSGHQLQAQILASDIVTATSGIITATNPGPGGGVSSSTYATVEVSAPRNNIRINPSESYALRNQEVWAAATADFNHDNKLDLLVAGGGPDVVYANGNGDGTFGSHALFPAPEAAGINFGDFNNDGNVDFFNLFTSATVFLGNGNGTFTSTSGSFGTFVDTFARPTVVGDFNGDGNLDMAVPDAAAYTIFVLLGNGDGTFQSQLSSGRLMQPFALVGADFNGDGIIDLVTETLTSHITSYDLDIQLGNPDGTFQSPITVATLTGTSKSFGTNLFVTDVNGDGKFDVVAGVTGQVAVLLGNGDGTFSGPAFYSTGFGSNLDFSLQTGDFNSDGKTDIVISGLEGVAKLRVLLGLGDGTFQPSLPVQLPILAAAETGITVGDLNSDGKLDMIMLGANAGIIVFTQK